MTHWQQLHIQAQEKDVDSLNDWLNEQGALAITLKDAGEQALLELPLDVTPIWKNNRLTALFPAYIDLTPIIGQLQQHYDDLKITQSRLAEQDWQRCCMDDFQPLRFGQQTWVCPSWHTPPNDQAINILLDPGLAFGTGTHPTTALCLNWIDEHPMHNKTVIDYGCGSGILALAALKHGAKHAYAIDHDPQALHATQANMQGNQIGMNNVTLALPDQIILPKVDVLIANILAQPLIELAPHFATLINAQGFIILSGLLSDQQDDILTIYQAYCDIQAIKQQGDWVAIIGQFNQL